MCEVFSELAGDNFEPDLNYLFHSTAGVDRNNSRGSNQGGGNTLNIPRPGVIVPPLFLAKTYKPVTMTSKSRPPASLKVAFCVFLIIIIFKVMSSTELVFNVDESSTRVGLGPNFIAIVLSPVLANTVKHMSAIMVAGRNKIDMNFGIVCGPSLKMALFVAPNLVIFSWVLGFTRIWLSFEAFGFMCLELIVLLVNAMRRDSHENWLEGTLFLICFFVTLEEFNGAFCISME